MFLQIRDGEESACRLHRGRDGLRRYAFVKAGAAFFGDALQHHGQTRVFPDFTRARSAACDGHLAQEVGLAAQARDGTLPVMRDEIRDGHPFLGSTNCRSQNLSQGQHAIARVQVAPALHTTRHRDGQGPIGRDALQAAALEFLECQSSGGAAAAFEAHHGPRARIPHHGKEIAADSATCGFGDALDCVGCDGGVDRTATGTQNVDGSQSGQGDARGRHPLRAACDGTRLKGCASDPVTGRRKQTGQTQQRGGHHHGGEDDRRAARTLLQECYCVTLVTEMPDGLRPTNTFGKFSKVPSWAWIWYGVMSSPPSFSA